MATEVRTGYSIPDNIKSTLSCKDMNEYNQYPWIFDLSELNSTDLAVVTSVQQMFVGSQRWKPEAFIMTLGKVDAVDMPERAITLFVALHAGGSVPIRTEGFVPMLRKRFLDLEKVLETTGYENQIKEERNGLRHNLRIVGTNIPQIGYFGSEMDLKEAGTPYYVDKILVEPFYYFKPNKRQNGLMTNWLTVIGEDSSRVIVRVDIKDGRETYKSRIYSVLSNHRLRIRRAENLEDTLVRQLVEAQLHLLLLKQQSETELISSLQELGQDLGLRPDPFNDIEF